MKTRSAILLGLAVMALVTTHRAVSESDPARPKMLGTNPIFEYASVRFMEEKTSIIWPDGSVENVMNLTGNRKFQNGNEKYPKGSDYRMYWLTVSLNIMGKRGFELAHSSESDVIMKRQVN